jgi:hypothetical protein
MRPYVRNARRMIMDTIKGDPIYITITRTTRTADNAGGYTEATTTVAEQAARMYSKSSMSVIPNEGGIARGISTRLLMVHDADVKRETEVNLDTFVVDTDTYKVVDVKLNTQNGMVVSRTCEVELL